MNKQIALMHKTWDWECVQIRYNIASENLNISTWYVNKEKQNKWYKSKKGRESQKKRRESTGGKEYLKRWRDKNPEKIRGYKKKLHKRDKELINTLKINGCAICGYDKCMAALEFHHVNPEDKKFLINVGQMHRSSMNIINEMEKCILLCNRCHKEIHAKEW